MKDTSVIDNMETSNLVYRGDERNKSFSHFIHVIHEPIVSPPAFERRQGSFNPTLPLTFPVITGKNLENSLGTSTCLVVLPSLQVVRLLAWMECESIDLGVESFRFRICLGHESAENPRLALNHRNADHDHEAL